jgi:hypothetical protein
MNENFFLTDTRRDRAVGRVKLKTGGPAERCAAVHNPMRYLAVVTLLAVAATTRFGTLLVSWRAHAAVTSTHDVKQRAIWSLQSSIILSITSRPATFGRLFNS